VHGTSDNGFGVSGDSNNKAGVLGTGFRGPGVQGQLQAADTMGFLGGRDPVFQQLAGVFGTSIQQGVMGLTAAPKGTGVYGGGTAATGGDQIGVRGETISGVGVQGQSFGSGLAGHFVGNVTVTGLLTAFDCTVSGADCAEDFDISRDQEVEPGTVMVIDRGGALKPSLEAYDKRVAGIVSGAGNYKPGITLDKRKSAGKRVPIALIGKAYCKVDASYSAIEVGDLLTSSATSGHAMKASDPSKALGAVIGKALQACTEGLSLIPILVTLQ